MTAHPSHLPLEIRPEPPYTTPTILESSYMSKKVACEVHVIGKKKGGEKSRARER